MSRPADPKVKLRNDIQACLTTLRALVNELIYEDSTKPIAATPALDGVNRIANIIGSTPEKIRMRSSDPIIVLNRQICQYLMRDCLQISYPEIAKATGVDDHTTIIHSYRKIEKLRTSNEKFDLKIRDLAGALLNRNAAKEIA